MFIGWTKGGFYIINFQVLWVFTLVLIIHWWNRIYLIISKALFWGYVGEGHVNLLILSVCIIYISCYSQIDQETMASTVQVAEWTALGT